jgi:hypothetical protein
MSRVSRAQRHPDPPPRRKGSWIYGSENDFFLFTEGQDGGAVARFLRVSPSPAQPIVPSASLSYPL